MKLVVGIDFSETTDKLLQKAHEIAVALAAEVWLVHVADPEPDFVGFEASPPYDREVRAKQFHLEHARIQSIASQWRSTGLDATALLVQGATADTLLHEASKLGADIIVVGSHSRGAVQRLLLGSVSGEVLRKAGCPVLIVPTHTWARADHS